MLRGYCALVLDTEVLCRVHEPWCNALQGCYTLVLDTKVLCRVHEPLVQCFSGILYLGACCMNPGAMLRRVVLCRVREPWCSALQGYYTLVLDAEVVNPGARVVPCEVQGSCTLVLET